MTAPTLETALEYVFVDTAIGGTSHRNHPMRYDAFRYAAAAVDVFATWMRYDGGLLNHFNTTRNTSDNKTVGGYRGVCSADRAPIDVDRDDLVEALADTRRLVSWLVSTWDIPAESLVIGLSGGKGFHVQLLAGLFGGFEPSADVPARVGRLIAALLEGSGITVDTAVYEHLRLWRESNTKHGKTGLFAIPLTVDELATLTMDEIRGLAIAPRNVERLDDEWNARPELVELWDATAKRTGKVIEPTPLAETLDGKIKAGEGRRHKALVSMAGTLRRRGLAADEITALLHAFNDTKFDLPTPEAEVREIAAWAAGFPIDGVPFDDQLWAKMTEPSSTAGANGHSKAASGGIVTAEPVLTSLSTLNPQPVHWVWPDRIPAGKLSLLVGDPGLGKSMTTLDVAARFSTGAEWPDGSGAPAVGNVLLISAEDDAADTILPRFLAAGGDPNHATMLTAVTVSVGSGDPRNVALSLDAHLEAVEQAIIKTGATLVVVDPLSAYLGKADSHSDAEIRGVLMPLAALAARTGAAILAVMHLNKRAAGPAMYRVNGSIGFVGAARAVHVITADPDDPSGPKRLFLPHKQNLSVPAAGLAYKVESTTVHGDDHMLIPTARIGWQPGTVATTASQALAAGDQDGAEVSALDDAKAFLRDILAGGPLASKEVERNARESDIRPITLRRARVALAIHSYREGFGKDGGWFWELPKQASADNNSPETQPPTEQPLLIKPPIDDHFSPVSNLSNNGANEHQWPAHPPANDSITDNRQGARSLSDRSAAEDAPTYHSLPPDWLTLHWQEYHAGDVLPNGAMIHTDFQTGRTFARLDDGQNPPLPAATAAGGSADGAAHEVFIL